MKIAKDLMTPKPITVLSSETIRDIAHTFIEKNISSAPIETPLGEVLGVISELSLSRALLREYLGDEAVKNQIFNHQDLFSLATFVQEDTPIVDVVNSILTSPDHKVFVLNNQERLTGVISPKDILCFLNGEDSKFIDLKSELEEANKKVSELTKKISKLKNVSETYIDLYEDAPSMMHSVDENGVIIMANKKIHNVLGYSNGALIGKSINDIYPKSVRHEAIQGLQKIKETGFHKAIYTTMITKTGSKLRVDVASSALHNENGKFVGSITVSRFVDSENLLRALHGTLNKSDQ